jgi:hypothetical protein
MIPAYSGIQDQVWDPGLWAGEGDPAMAGLTTPVRSPRPTGQAGIHWVFRGLKFEPDPEGKCFAFHRAGAKIAGTCHSRTAFPITRCFLSIDQILPERCINIGSKSASLTLYQAIKERLSIFKTSPYVRYAFVLENGQPPLADPIYTVLYSSFMQR